MMDEDIHLHLDAGRYRRAIDLLVDRYQAKVFHLSLGFMRNRGAAEDLAQEIFIRVWKGLSGYSRGASLSTWIYAIGRNACLSELRRLASRPVVCPDESVLDRLAAAPAPEPDGGVAMDIHAMLRQLPDRYRQAVTLYYLEEKSYQEVAAMLGIPMGTVKTFLHRAKKELVQISQRCEDAYGLS